ncbi:MAG: hypothetical protein KKG53_03150 [Proteobacteria bacterium]|nr:hypothetical protein [Pseudomonadota bacterium]
MRRFFGRPCSLMLVLQFVCSLVLPGLGNTAFASDDWKNEFNTVCGQTQNALAFSVDELKDLIARCDELKPRIKKLDDSQATERKVFLQRLKMCRDFYAFALGTKVDQQ